DEPHHQARDHGSQRAVRRCRGGAGRPRDPARASLAAAALTAAAGRPPEAPLGRSAHVLAEVSPEDRYGVPTPVSRQYLHPVTSQASFSPERRGRRCATISPLTSPPTTLRSNSQP